MKIFQGVFPKTFKKVRVLPGVAKKFCLPSRSGSGHVGASRLSGLRRFAAAGKTPSRHQVKPSFFSKFWAKPLRKFPKFWGDPKPLRQKMRISRGERDLSLNHLTPSPYPPLPVLKTHTFVHGWVQYRIYSRCMVKIANLLG